MREFHMGTYDVAVIGGGHAGCEAAFASARLGCSTIMFATNLDFIANMACNPCIGGTAKGQLVREIDALGGEMGKVADFAAIQSRILNRGKGPAVYSPRAQADRRAYTDEMKKRIERQPNLELKQAEVVNIGFDENGSVCSVTTHLGAKFDVKAVIIATGTFLKGKIIVGDVAYESGPDGVFPANTLSSCLKENGIKLMRFKTGTPARVAKSSLDFSKMEVQKGDEVVTPFSFETKNPNPNAADCYITYTNEETHRIIQENIHRSPLFNGLIEGIGPRYCPSIEDKIRRFPDKERHQLFIEPLGLNTDEMYIQGFSTSLPEDVQVKMIHSLPGLENAIITRTAYAIEYDCCDSTMLYPTLEFKDHSGLYGAGQFNGSSGYEEAAGQGLMAGINAARKIQGKDPVILDRSQGYIGTLIDDLTSKGTNEPYRMMTSRSEYRLLLRQDNADLRLTEIGHDIGLISDERYADFLTKKSLIENEIERVNSINVGPSEKVNELLTRNGTTPITTGVKFADLIRRPELDYFALEEIDSQREPLPRDVAEQVNIQIKYEGYIQKQEAQAKKAEKTEKIKIPEGMDFLAIDGLRLEARQKLDAIKPLTLGQASRISGVSPADIDVLFIHLAKKSREENIKNI
ncbi:MAG: tRNA uridine-5-carboxymethylaminomethyl(34) synthesis enzyme MnmG [Clostridia bacterium]|nr:tRNA uridine-5-carboxymethylaminomethyl(34) synthesis enzyme MnmG [Clostridia bacterium]